MCRAYCAQTWEEALNQAGIEASSELRKPENIIFPPALKQQLEEANKLKDLAKKAKLQAEKKKVKVEKERDEAEQHGYDVGVAETEDALWPEVLAVYHAYCAQTWEEALNQAGVEASSGLRRPKHYLPLSPANSEAD